MSNKISANKVDAGVKILKSRESMITPNKSTPKQIVEAKREAKLREEQENLTFRPHVNTKGFDIEGDLLERTQADIIKRRKYTIITMTSMHII